MKFVSKITLCMLALMVSSHSFADESDALLDREKTLATMRFKRDQLKIQSEMSTSYKTMSDAAFIVDEDGQPMGVKNIQELGIQVRKGGRVETNPFASAGTQSAPNGMPFMLDQQGLGSTLPPMTGTAQTSFAPHPTPAVPPVEQTKAPEPEKDVHKKLELRQVDASTVTVRTDDGDQVLRIGEKVYDLTLTKFTIDQAFLKDPKGATKVISFDWASKR